MLIVLNNKSNLNKDEYLKYIKELSHINTTHELILCPSTINIALSSDIKNIKLGAQNVSSYKNGAHTGEVSSTQLASYNVEYTLIGHSERRKEQKETEEIFKYKINNLLEENITPIYCIGESIEEKNKSMTVDVIKKQLQIVEGYSNNIIIAYEPIWSIGTGVIPENKHIQEVINTIKDILPNNKVLYGGSINEENIKEISNIKNIDGYLIGGVSLFPEKINNLLQNMNN